MLKPLLLSSIAMVTLAGCASAQQVVEKTPQYCYTDQEIVVQNGSTVSSATRVECTDDQIKRLAQKRLGIAPNCGHFTYWMKQGGKDVQQRGISCQRPDGSWEIVNTAGY